MRLVGLVTWRVSHSSPNGWHPLVERIAKLADSIAKDNWNGYGGLRTMHLPFPNHLVGHVPPDAFQQRMSVVYGLSVPEINIGTIEPPTAIEDVPVGPSPGTGRWKDRFVDQDQT